MMKRIKIFSWQLVVAAMLISSFAGCKKFLDRKPLQGTLDDYGVEQQVMGLYSILRTYAGFNTLPWLDFHSIRDDDAQKGSDASDGAEIIAEFETFQYTKDDWATNSYWNDHYYMINRCNSILKTAELAGLTDELSKRNVGEAKWVRAYCYFNLVRTYGEVPLFDTYAEAPKDAVKPKSPIADIYALIDSDLEDAALALPLNWNTGAGNSFPGRLTSGAANTLWAQTYMFRSNWSRALALCNAVINSNQYSLQPFEQIFKDGLGGAGKNGPESIFEIQAHVGPGGSPDLGTNYGTSQNVRQGGAPPEWNLGWGWNTPTDKLEADWSNTDPRKRKTILYSGEDDGGAAQGGYSTVANPVVLPPYPTIPQKYWNKKVYSDPAMRASVGGSGNASWINHRVLRYADVLLMKAEAANELNDGATAATELEKVRNRARGGNASVLPAIAFASKDQMRTAIKNERRWEFAMEGLRFYDLVRWNDAEAVLGPLGYTSRCKFYPIPQKAIDLTGGILIQNPEWQ